MVLVGPGMQMKRPILRSANGHPRTLPADSNVPISAQSAAVRLYSGFFALFDMGAAAAPGTLVCVASIHLP
jgi:hypothetical protein